MATARSSRSRTPERVSGAPARLGNTGASGAGLIWPSQPRSSAAVFFQSGMTRCLRPLPCRCTAVWPVQQHVTDLQAGEFGDAGAGVVGGGEQDRVAPSAPGAAVGCGQDRGDLFAGQVAEHRPVEAFGRDGQHACGDRQRGRVADGGVAHERVDRGQPGVAGAGAVAAVGLEVVEEVQHERRVQVGQLQRARLACRCVARRSRAAARTRRGRPRRCGRWRRAGRSGGAGRSPAPAAGTRSAALS